MEFEVVLLSGNRRRSG